MRIGTLVKWQKGRLTPNQIQQFDKEDSLCNNVNLERAWSPSLTVCYLCWLVLAEHGQIGQQMNCWRTIWQQLVVKRGVGRRYRGTILGSCVGIQMRMINTTLRNPMSKHHSIADLQGLHFLDVDNTMCPKLD